MVVTIAAGHAWIRAVTPVFYVLALLGLARRAHARSARRSTARTPGSCSAAASPSSPPSSPRSRSSWAGDGADAAAGQDAGRCRARSPPVIPRRLAPRGARRPPDRLHHAAARPRLGHGDRWSTIARHAARRRRRQPLARRPARCRRGGRRRRPPPSSHLLAKHQVNRFAAFADPHLDPQGVGYNTAQARLAIGSGGLLGKGLFHGTQTNGRYVPEQQTDFVFTVAGEELGFVGGVAAHRCCSASCCWRGIADRPRSATTCSACWSAPAWSAGSPSRPSRTSA